MAPRVDTVVCEDAIKIYDKYRNLVLSDDRFKSCMDYNWYKIPYENRNMNRRADPHVISALDLLPNEISVIDFCCGIPWLWELIETKVKVKEFVGIDLITPDLFAETLKDIKADVTYHAQDVFDVLTDFFSLHRKFDLVISANAKVELGHLLPFVKKSGVIVWNYTEIEVKQRINDG